MKLVLLFWAAASAMLAADLTGNWMAAVASGDGTMRRTYLNLKQDGNKITGTVRTGQFFYNIDNANGGPDAFTLNVKMTDGNTERRTTVQVRLEGDELHVSLMGRGNTPSPAMSAHRVPPGEGAMPARIALPALHPVHNNGLARTPPMGWNSWNKFARRVDDATVRGIADVIASNGMRDAGYLYINIDDTWQGERDAQGNIRGNDKFPNMKALADYVHSKGLKLGLYSSPGPNTCAGYEGSHGHEIQDARTYAQWGIDYLKYDWCGARNLYSDSEMQALYQIMGEALATSGRAIVYSLCQYGRADVWKWGPEVGGNLWRTTGDIRDSWDSMTHIGFSQDQLAPYAKPGHWNDPDMLEIGNGGMSDAEYRTHMTLWSMLAAPLIAGNDVRDMSESVRAILLNRDVIAIDQDAAGKQAQRLVQDGDHEIWVRPLANGDHAVALFNRGATDARVTVAWSKVGLAKAPAQARDLWSHAGIKLSGSGYTAEVPGHGVVLLRVR